MIDWDDPAVRAIIACRDGRQAWEMLVAYLTPFRDAIWTRRREAKPKRGGRRSGTTRKLLAANAATTPLLN